MGKKIVMLAGGRGSSTRFLYHAIHPGFPIERVIVEEPVSRKAFLKRRVKKLGYVTVFGQVLFQLFWVPLLRFFSKKRLTEIEQAYHLSSAPIDPEKLIQVSSVNSEECLRLLRDLAPDIVIVNGTRIISRKVLQNVPAVFLNTHAGITPKYRGVHGAYWALVNRDPEHCGVTVHMVDEGIDTGGILYQKTIQVTPRDNFTTYTHLQSAEGISLMKQALQDALEGRLTPVPGTRESHLWYHPTLWAYLYYWVVKGVK